MKKFTFKKEVKAIARDRVGRVPSSKVIRSKKDKPQDESCPYCGVRGCEMECLTGGLSFSGW